MCKILEVKGFIKEILSYFDSGISKFLLGLKSNIWMVKRYE